ncbi:UTP--glucose-1-phosphate uridylyltransferase GalU [Paenalcaligenes faecalis]|uniref:UTP--glucose-1-phosphate uridylyltransferase GalU n=1 Tax=Paenalcaligenes faecalis TaxID=2980099 RepID=UPI0022B9ABB7|nr:UTP--glucose-1-phosphate uridylyltransferase GalU [Paenalcaligenes faecalis]
MKPIRKAVFPVAGLGTRFLPATKAMPKEMLPIVDKPLIQYAVEEAVAAGITDLIFITGRNKRAIEDHFDRQPELESELIAKEKADMLALVRHVIPSHVNCIYIRQGSPLGLGHAVLCAEPAVGNEPFVVILADDLIDAETAVTRQLVDAAHSNNGSIVAVQTVAAQDTDKYGIISGTAVNSSTTRVESIVEKPSPETAPSLNAVVGRYVLEPEIFACLRQTQPGKGGEIQLTDGIALLMQQKPVFGHTYEGLRYDCGSKEGFFQATVAYGKKYHGFE